MKKYRFILPALLAVGILTTTFATETVPRITADGNAPSGILRCGETAELTIALSPLPEEAKYLKCEQFVNGKKVSEQFIPASEKFQVKKSLTDPGWFALLGTACDAERKPLPNPRPAHAWDKVLKGGNRRALFAGKDSAPSGPGGFRSVLAAAARRTRQGSAPGEAA